MAAFFYKGYREGGRTVQGTVEAVSLRAAREQLLASGILVRQLDSTDTASQRNRRDASLPAALRVQLYREWATLLRSALPLERGMDLVCGTPEFVRWDLPLTRVRIGIQEGRMLADVLREVTAGERPFEYAVLQVGEESGSLDGAMDLAADYLEQDLELREQMLTALLYPLVVVIMSGLVLGISSIWLLPGFERTLTSAGLPVPFWTALVTQGGRWMSALLLFASLAAALRAGPLKTRWKSRGGMSQAWEARCKRLPGIGSYLQSVFTFRFSRSLSALLESGLTLSRAVALAGRSSGSSQITEHTAQAEKRISEGHSLADALTDAPWLGSTLPSWVRAGEESGALGIMLHQAAEREQRRAQRMRERFLRLLEPILIVFIGLFVLALALAMMAPILSINNLLSSGG